MPEIKPLKLKDLGGGDGQLREFESGDKIAAALLALEAWATAATPDAALNALEFTAIGKALAKAADAAAGRTALGLGSAALRPAVTGPADITSGALLQVGSFGLGAVVGNQGYVTNVNQLTTTRFFAWTSGGANGLPAGTGVGMWVFGAEGYGTGFLLDYVGEQHYTIRQTGGIWYGPFLLLTTANAVGNVGAGALVQYGSSVTGQYWRYAGGMQVCTSIIATGDTAKTWYYPAGFADIPQVIPAMDAGSPVMSAVSAVGYSSVTLHAFNLSGNYFPGLYYRLVAVGRWS